VSNIGSVEVIRSSRHMVKFSNLCKLEKLYEFIGEYRTVCQVVLDEVWERGYGDTFNVAEDKLELPKYLDPKKFRGMVISSRRIGAYSLGFY